MRNRVFTVGHFYDGPRAGIAEYRGYPCLYECQYSESEDEYTEFYRLSKVDEQLFQLALEDWDIFLKWRTAFDEGKTDQSTHPALPEDRRRHVEIQNILSPKLKIDENNQVTVRGSFIPTGDGPFSYEVEWSESI